MAFTDYDAVLSTTLKNYRSTLEDNVFNGRPMTNWLKAKNRITTKTGGAKIVVPVIYSENDTVGSYSGYDTLPTTPQEGIGAAEYDWKQVAASVAISGIEEAKNNGESEVIDLLEAKIIQAEESLQEHFNAMFFAAAPATNDFNSLVKIVDDSSTIGGIDRGTYTWWKAKVTGSVGQLVLADMSSMWNDVAQGTSNTPDFIITTDTLWERYEALLQPNLRYSDPKTADAGFVNLLYKGAPVVFDIDCTSGAMYFLNSKVLKLVRHSETWFKNTPFMRPPNQDARYAQILSYGELTVNQPRRLGVLTGATA